MAKSEREPPIVAEIHEYQREMLDEIIRLRVELLRELQALHETFAQASVKATQLGIDTEALAAAQALELTDMTEFNARNEDE